MLTIVDALQFKAHARFLVFGIFCQVTLELLGSCYPRILGTHLNGVYEYVRAGTVSSGHGMFIDFFLIEVKPHCSRQSDNEMLISFAVMKSALQMNEL